MFNKLIIIYSIEEYFEYVNMLFVVSVGNDIIYVEGELVMLFG